MLISDEAFLGIIQDTWNSTLGFQIDRAESAPGSTARALTVGVKITGAWVGEVRFECSLRLARLIAAAIFRVETGQVEPDQIVDALSELIHIIGGNLKALLPQPVELSFPFFPEHRQAAQFTTSPEALCLRLASEGHTFVMSILADAAVPPRIGSQ